MPQEILKNTTGVLLKLSYILGTRLHERDCHIKVKSQLSKGNLISDPYIKISILEYCLVIPQQATSRQDLHSSIYAIKKYCTENFVYNYWVLKEMGMLALNIPQEALLTTSL